MDNDNQILEDVGQQTTQEELVPKSRVNEIVQKRMAEAAEKARREAEAHYKQQLEAQQRQSMQQAQVSGQVQPSVDEITAQVQNRLMQEFSQRQQEQEMQNVANNYLNKMAAGKDSYEDFNEVTKDFDPAEFPQLVYLVAGMDGAADVIYDLAQNPLKLAAMHTLAQSAPKKAQSELLKIANSIRDNRQAVAEAESQQSDEPLSRMQPSRLGASNGKPQTISDLRAQPWLRG